MLGSRAYLRGLLKPGSNAIIRGTIMGGRECRVIDG